MKIKQNILLIFLLGIILIMSNLVYAQEIVNPYDKIEGRALKQASTTEFMDTSDSKINRRVKDNTFRAQVIEILKERVVVNKDGQNIKQQNLKLKVLDGDLKNQEIIFYGIDDLEVSLSKNYHLGDKVIVSSNEYPGGETVYYIIDFVRNGKIYFLFLLFVSIVILVGRWKGVRAILSLLVSFLIILKFIIPAILNNYSPILIGISGGFIILFFIIYITEGINKKSHIAVFSILISLLLTGILASIFSNAMRLSGMSEDSIYLINLIGKTINFKGLLLTGVIIGSLGVLNDMVVSQIYVVQEIKDTDKTLSHKEIFKRAYRIGTSHVSSMTNTLFLAYAGSSLTLLLLFSVANANFVNIINNHLISTEIFRALVGAIGIVLSMPISTFLAIRYLKNN